jgi:hypothetical protein
MELILDRGMVIDVFLRVSLVGIEILRVDARVVVASVDTYLRFAEACNRLDLENDENSTTVPELLGGGGSGGGMGRKAVKKAAKSMGSSVRDAIGGDDDDDGDEDGQEEERPKRSRQRAGTAERRKSRS